nr:MAG TPA: hypothetical protein [Caudoviricetes sp.]
MRHLIQFSSCLKKSNKKSHYPSIFSIPRGWTILPLFSGFSQSAK